MRNSELERLMELLARFYEIAPDGMRSDISRVRAAVEAEIDEWDVRAVTGR